MIYLNISKIELIINLFNSLFSFHARKFIDSSSADPNSCFVTKLNYIATVRSLI